MRIYLGQTRSRALIHELESHGFGEMVSRGEFPPRRQPWAYDNGAFADWRAGRPFDTDAFLRDIDAIAGFDERPDFLVLPDIVMGGPKSLERSLAWTPELDGVAPLYLPVQDGMSILDVGEAVKQGASIAGLFVGGSLRWKLRSLEQWVTFGRDHVLPVHVGRFGTPDRLTAAKRLGVDSIDSALPLWSREKLTEFIGAIGKPSQGVLAL